MASGRKRVRLTVDVALPSEDAKASFKDRLFSVRDLLSPPGGPKLDKLVLLAEASQSPSAGAHSSMAHTGSFLLYSGMQIKL